MADANDPDSGLDRGQTEDGRPGGDPGLSLRLRVAIALSPVAFFLHDLEELVTLDRLPAPPESFVSLIPTPTPAAFAWSIGILFAIHAAAAAALLRWPRSRSIAIAFIVLVAARFVNAMAHLLRAGVEGAYVSGAWTALGIVAPVAAGLVIGLGTRNGMRRMEWLTVAAAAVLIQLPILVFVLRVGHWLAGPT